MAAEVLFLRKQLAYYRDHNIRPRRLTDAARLSLILWSRFFDWKEALAVVTPGTFVRWHRKGFKLYWRWKSRGDRPALGMGDSHQRSPLIPSLAFLKLGSICRAFS